MLHQLSIIKGKWNLYKREGGSKQDLKKRWILMLGGPNLFLKKLALRSLGRSFHQIQELTLNPKFASLSARNCPIYRCENWDTVMFMFIVILNQLVHLFLRFQGTKDIVLESVSKIDSSTFAIYNLYSSHGLW